MWESAILLKNDYIFLLEHKMLSFSAGAARHDSLVIVRLLTDLMIHGEETFTNVLTLSKLVAAWWCGG